MKLKVIKNRMKRLVQERIRLYRQKKLQKYFMT